VLDEGAFVDGDKTKLDGIAAGATANAGTVTGVTGTLPISSTGGATPAISIAAATTSAAGSMSSADKTKLDGIEANADVTDTTNVTAAGALMDSEVTNLADVKAFDTSDYATAAQGAKADSAQQPPSEGAFANGDKTKLDAIAAGATAYNDAAAIAAVEGEATLDLGGAVTIAGESKLERAKVVTLSTGGGNTLTAATHSGTYCYVTAGDVTLFAISAVGQQVLIMNDTGGSITLSKDAGDTLVGTTTILDEATVTCVAVTASTWFVIG
jgi:hypothetical protein